MSRGRTMAGDAKNRAIGEDAPPSLEFVERSCSSALAGTCPGVDELCVLLETEPGTEQADLLGETEETLARRGNGGLGYVYAQVGIDANPCPGNCHFCDFALCNKADLARCEVPFDQVIHVSELFAEQGVHLLSVMSSAAYQFERYLELMSSIRATVGGGMALMANTRDLSRDEAVSLMQAGADCIYHAVRIGEGVITGFSEESRWQTLRNAQAAGLDVATAVGPLFQPVAQDGPYYQSKGAIAQRMLDVVACKPICSGVTRLHSVQGTKMEHVRPWPPERMRVFSGVYQLAARDTVPHGGFGSIRWVDAGLDPRQRGYTSDDDRLVKRVRKLREDLETDGWRVAPADFMYNNR